MRVFAGLVRTYALVSYGFCVNGKKLTLKGNAREIVCDMPGCYHVVNFAAETFMNEVRPFVGSYLDKFEIYGTRIEKWKPRIFRTISADQLAPAYGGSSDWRPVPFKR